MKAHYDVVVVGGGPAGWPAAAQAARLGASTLLVEKNGALGGTTVVGGVALPGLFHAWGRQVIAGIGWEAVRRSTEIAGVALPDFTAWQLPHYKLQVPVSPAILAAVIDGVMVESGVDLSLHTMLAAVDRLRDAWRVTLCAKEGLVDVTADQLVDCTGDADIVGHLGLPREANAERQPGTLMVRFGGYDPRTLDYDTLDRAHAEALGDGTLLPEDMLDGAGAIRAFLTGRGENRIHIVGATSGTSAARTDAELAARRALLRIFQFLRRQEGLHDLTVERWAIECGIRESFTIRGHARITTEDYASGRLWPDAVSYSFYPIDIHNPTGLGIDIRPLPYGVVPTIPRGAMVPLDSSHLIVAGRSICGDQGANSAYRVQASCMAMGQAAGANAALAAERGCDVLDVDIAGVRQALHKHGAIVPWDAASSTTV